MTTRGCGLRSQLRRSALVGIVAVMTIALVSAVAPIAMARVDDPGLPAGSLYAPYTEGYQPYETGPVIHPSWLAPYAPYTQGYQPYETGPVVHPSWLAQ